MSYFSCKKFAFHWSVFVFMSWLNLLNNWLRAGDGFMLNCLHESFEDFVILFCRILVIVYLPTCIHVCDFLTSFRCVNCIFLSVNERMYGKWSLACHKQIFHSPICLCSWLIPETLKSHLLQMNFCMHNLPKI